MIVDFHADQLRLCFEWRYWPIVGGDEIYVITTRAARVIFFSVVFVCAYLFVCFFVCQHNTITPEPLEISSRIFRDMILWSKGRTHWKMAILWVGGWRFNISGVLLLFLVVWILFWYQLCGHVRFTCFQKNILQKLKDNLGIDTDVYDDEYIANNLLKLNVFYREHSYKEIIEKPSYTVWMLKIYRPTVYYRMR